MACHQSCFSHWLWGQRPIDAALERHILLLGWRTVRFRQRRAACCCCPALWKLFRCHPADQLGCDGYCRRGAARLAPAVTYWSPLRPSGTACSCTAPQVWSLRSADGGSPANWRGAHKSISHPNCEAERTDSWAHSAWTGGIVRIFVIIGAYLVSCLAAATVLMAATVLTLPPSDNQIAHMLGAAFPLAPSLRDFQRYLPRQSSPMPNDTIGALRCSMRQLPRRWQ